jgi:hypothetical protein
MEVYEQETPDFKSHTLPLARIKKVMKMDEDVKVCRLPRELPGRTGPQLLGRPVTLPPTLIGYCRSF